MSAAPAKSPNSPIAVTAGQLVSVYGEIASNTVVLRRDDTTTFLGSRNARLAEMNPNNSLLNAYRLQRSRAYLDSFDLTHWRLQESGWTNQVTDWSKCDEKPRCLELNIPGALELIAGRAVSESWKHRSRE